jgi:xylitol oxidase
MATIGTNWAGNHTYRAARLREPTSLDELRSIVMAAPKIHVLGSRHCFNDIADSAELVTLDRLDQPIKIDRAAGTVTVGGSIRYGALAQALVREGLALHNMASLPHISVAGAIATATHGSGDGNGNLATAVAALDLVTSDGELLTVSRGDEDFHGTVVSLGALGVVSSVTLDVEPTYHMRQQVFDNLDWDVLYDQCDDVMSAADSVSLFTDYGDTVDQVWVKSRVDPANPAVLPDSFNGAMAARYPLHPVRRLSADTCTEQLGVPGTWADRLPHFRMESVPASGDEIQAEYMIPRQLAVPALRALRDIAPLIQPHMHISEVRTVAADDFWLSTAYETDTVCIHFSWKSDPATVQRMLPLVEQALAPFEPRPHWGKVFGFDASHLANRYDRLPQFRRLASKLDSRAAFRNEFLDRYVFT